MIRTCAILFCVLSTSVLIAAPVQRNSTAAGTMYGGDVTDQDWGRPVTSGDLDGDGYDDVITSASKAYGDVISRVYVFRGGPQAHGRGLVDVSSNGADQVILGAALNDNLGSSMATGDVNGDGIDDLVLCASNATFSGRVSAGFAYLILGGPTFFASATRDLAVTGSWHERMAGPVAGGDMGGSNAFGGLDAHAVAIGNLDGDSKGDILLGVHLANGAATESGRVYLIRGSKIAPPSWPNITLDLNVTTGYSARIDGKGQYDELGDCVLTGDLTGDGIDEIIIPNRNYSQALFGTEGAVHIFRGRTTWPASFNLGTTPADITLLGYREYDELGNAAAVGDFNDDGITDLASAAPGAELGTWTNQIGDGLIYGLFGSTNLQTGTITIDYATATPDFLLVGEYQESLGAEVSAGDFNGDGIDDLAAAEWFGGPETNGVVEVLFGRHFVGQPTFTANVNTDLHIVGAAQDRIGFSMGAADVNNDGLSEILFGTPFNNADRGTIYVYTHVTGDFDHNGALDLFDFAAFQACFTGTPALGSLGPGCFVFDYDLDTDIDEIDFATWLGNFTGPAL